MDILRFPLLVFALAHLIGIPLAIFGEGNTIVTLLAIAIIGAGEIFGLFAMILFAAGFTAHFIRTDKTNS